MKPTPILDFWQKPADAGAPVAMLATTFAFETDFFEQNCLARFLEVSSVNEDTGSVDDIVASVELHELLQNARVTVLADRRAPAQRTSLLWDLLTCQVDGGLLHAKVAVLLWEDATRVIVGSANLTSAGYRRQIELALAADLGPTCLFQQELLMSIADELQSYLRIVPGFASTQAVFTRAASTLDLFRQRIARQPPVRTTVRAVFAPTNATRTPLEQLPAVWNGPQPLCATHLSPFWDTGDLAALLTVKRLLTGRPAADRSQHIAVVLGPRGQIAFPKPLAEAAGVSVHELKKLDKEMRTLHAKCLLVESEQWVAALVGSSNHTKAGLGLIARRHREMNVWLGAPRGSKEGKVLLDLVQLGRTVPADAEEVEPQDEDETELPALPTCFGLCRVTLPSLDASWQLQLGITTTKDMPAAWSVSIAGESPLLTRKQWTDEGSPPSVTITLSQEALPMYVLVSWGSYAVPWGVVADDRHHLPPGPALSNLRAQHLLDALATGRSLAQVLRKELEPPSGTDQDHKPGINLDPLKRFEVEGSLLRKGRALAASLAAMQRRLERQVVTIDTLRARLAGPLGPEFVAAKIVEDFESGQQGRAEAVFTLAEIALAVGRVNWAHVVEHIDTTQGHALVTETLSRLDVLLQRLGDDPPELASYARRAIREARRCLPS